MPIFTVRLSAMSETEADVEIEADSPEEAIEQARIDAESHDFEIVELGSIEAEILTQH